MDKKMDSIASYAHFNDADLKNLMKFWSFERNGALLYIYEPFKERSW